MQVRELVTERRNRATEKLDTMSAFEIVTAMNHEDAAVPRAIRRALPVIAKAVDLVAERLAQGGRMIYVGSGTSGRIGALDASECPPTFGVSADMVQFVIAGGERALVKAAEASEDSVELGRRDMAREENRQARRRRRNCGQRVYSVYNQRVGVCAQQGRRDDRGRLQSQLGPGERLPHLAIEVEVGPEVLPARRDLRRERRKSSSAIC